MLRALVTSLCLLALPFPGAAAEVEVAPGALASAIENAADGDVLRLRPGTYRGPIVLERPLTIDGGGQAHIEGSGTGSVITITGQGAVVRGLTITGSGSSHETIDSGIQVTKKARDALIEDNHIEGNLYGVDIHGGKDTIVRGNLIIGRQDHRMNDRGNGVYVWNAPGAIVEENEFQYGRDGIFVNTSKRNIFRNNYFHDLRFAVHYMYANRSEVTGNLSIGNDLGYAIMFSDRILIENNVSIDDVEHGIMMNYANNATVRGNLIRGTSDRCLFFYNAHKNDVRGNRFEGCGIGIHFTAGSERNHIVENAFIGNRTQVKYVSTKWVEWSEEGRGNYWSDFATYDVNGDGIADAPYRPNDSMDHVLWTQPSAKLLLGSPAVQLVRWSQSAFPALLPGGVVDSFPLMRPVEIDVPDWRAQYDG